VIAWSSVTRLGTTRQVGCPSCKQTEC